MAAMILLWAGPSLGQTRMPQLPPPNLGQPAEPSPAPASVPAAAAAAPGEMPAVTISARLDQTEVHARDPFRCTITVSWDKKPAGQTAELDFDFPDPPRSEGIRVTGNSFKASAVADQGAVHVVREYTYELAADKEGKLSIGATAVVFRRRGGGDEQKLMTHPLEITVLKPRLRLTEVISPHRTKLIIAAALVLAVAGLAAIVIRERRKKPEPAPAPTEALEDRYLRQLKDNETHRIAGHYAEYFLGLAAVLKGYLRERYEIRTQGQTTDKIADALKQAADQETADAVRNTLHLCDRVKFAGAQPGPAEMDRAYEAARGLLKASAGSSNVGARLAAPESGRASPAPTKE